MTIINITPEIGQDSLTAGFDASINLDEFADCVEYDSSYVNGLNIAFSTATQILSSAHASISSPMDTISHQQVSILNSQIKTVCSYIGLDYVIPDMGNEGYVPHNLAEHSKVSLVAIKDALWEVYRLAMSAIKFIRDQLDTFWKKHISNLGRMRKKLPALQLKIVALIDKNPELQEVDWGTIVSRAGASGELNLVGHLELLSTTMHGLNGVPKLSTSLKMIEGYLSNTDLANKDSIENGIFLMNMAAVKAITDSFHMHTDSASGDQKAGDEDAGWTGIFPGNWGLYTARRGDIVVSEVNFRGYPPATKRVRLTPALSELLSLTYKLETITDLIHSEDKKRKSVTRAIDKVTKLMGDKKRVLSSAGDDASKVANAIKAIASAVTTPHAEMNSRIGTTAMEYYRFIVTCISKYE